MHYPTLSILRTIESEISYGLCLSGSKIGVAETSFDMSFIVTTINNFNLYTHTTSVTVETIIAKPSAILDNSPVCFCNITSYSYLPGTNTAVCESDRIKVMSLFAFSIVKSAMF